MVAVGAALFFLLTHIFVIFFLQTFTPSMLTVSTDQPARSAGLNIATNSPIDPERKEKKEKILASKVYLWLLLYKAFFTGNKSQIK